MANMGSAAGTGVGMIVTPSGVVNVTAKRSSVNPSRSSRLAPGVWRGLIIGRVSGDDLAGSLENAPTGSAESRWGILGTVKPTEFFCLPGDEAETKRAPNHHPESRHVPCTNM